MNMEHIRQLAELIRQTGVTGIEVTESGVRVRLENYPYLPLPVADPAGAPGRATVPPVPDERWQDPPDVGVVDFNKLREIRSPMVGLFHRAPAPGSPPFVSKGDRIRKGDVLCIVEAMKMMNEITADGDGEIVDVCVENGQLVEYGQVLFKVF